MGDVQENDEEELPNARLFLHQTSPTHRLQACRNFFLAYTMQSPPLGLILRVHS